MPRRPLMFWSIVIDGDTYVGRDYKSAADAVFAALLKRENDIIAAEKKECAPAWEAYYATIKDEPFGHDGDPELRRAWRECGEKFSMFDGSHLISVERLPVGAGQRVQAKMRKVSE